MVGFVIFGHYAARYFEMPWIEYAGIFWGVFGNLFIMLRQLKKIEERFKKQEKNGKKVDESEDS